MRNHSDDRLNIDSFYIMFSSYFLLLKTLGFSPGVFNFLQHPFGGKSSQPVYKKMEKFMVILSFVC